jgi:hypothetical protein
MDLREWLKQFRALHQEAKRGSLDAQALADYHAARDELARALLAAQHVALEPGQRPRRMLRAYCALQADLEFFDGTLRVTTRQVSSGGFSALLARPPRLDEEVKVALRVPGGEPLKGSARVVESKPQAGAAPVSFRWVGLTDAETERLEVFVFDAVLDQMPAAR